MELQPGGFEPNPKHEQNICFFACILQTACSYQYSPTCKRIYIFGVVKTVIHILHLGLNLSIN